MESKTTEVSNDEVPAGAPAYQSTTPRQRDDGADDGICSAMGNVKATADKTLGSESAIYLTADEEVNSSALPSLSDGFHPGWNVIKTATRQ